MAIEMELVGVKIQMPTNSPVLILREAAGEKRLVPIFIGGPEAHAIDLAISGTETLRPMTHDLFINLLEGLNSSLETIVISDLRDGTFYADLHIIDADQKKQIISARPSDAIALAARTKVNIFIEEEVLEEAGIYEVVDSANANGEEKMVEELRKFLDDVNPEDFLP